MAFENLFTGIAVAVIVMAFALYLDLTRPTCSSGSPPTPITGTWGYSSPLKG